MLLDSEEKYSLIKNTREGTQNRIIAEIFNNNIGKLLSKREIKKEYGLKISCKNIDFSKINSLEELIKQSKLLPGDLQRDIRTFYEMHKKYGLIKEGKGKNIKYTWNPVNKYEDFIQSCPRNLFKTKKERFTFCNSKNNKCELCNVSCDRMAVDHWRAQSVYEIDNIEIAV